MPFTVIHRGKTDEYGYDAYVRQLDKHHIDRVAGLRVLEPETHSRWLPVWERREDAETLAVAVRKDSRDRNWHVHELTADERVSRGPLGPISIYINKQGEDWVFALDPESQSLVERYLPEASRVDRVLLGISSRNSSPPFNFGTRAAEFFDQVAALLTGLSPTQLRVFGGFRVYDPVDEQTIKPAPIAVNGR
jgi:hypothetical protein